MGGAGGTGGHQIPVPFGVGFGRGQKKGRGVSMESRGPGGEPKGQRTFVLGFEERVNNTQK